MFFFTKQYFLVDALQGMVDIHNHVLPNIDDGSDSLETTEQMIQYYKDLGFKGIYTTPHTMEDYYGNDASKITACLEATKKELHTKESEFLLGTASEYMMDGGFSQILNNQNYLTLPSKHLLFEFSYFQKPSNAEELIFEMTHLDLQPILAHPERYRYLTVKEMVEFKNRGCLLQLNLLSLSGHYGKDAKLKAVQLLENHHYSFVATDAHKVEHLAKLKTIKLPKKIQSQITSVIEQSHFS